MFPVLLVMCLQGEAQQGHAQWELVRKISVFTEGGNHERI